MPQIAFPKTLEAAQKGEKALWQLGDALLREADETFIGKRGLEAVSAELAAHGLDHSASHLSQVRQTAKWFPPKDRYAEISFSAHIFAGSPQNLNPIMRGARKRKQRVTVRYVQNAMNELRRDLMRGHIEQRETAKTREEWAADAVHRARVLEEASPPAEREAASSRRQQAERDHREAREAFQAIPIRPPRSTPLPIDEDEDLSPLQVRAQAMAQGGQARRLAEETHKALKGVLDDLKPPAIAAITERWLEAANACREVADLVRSRSTNKRSHLTAVNE